MVSVKKKSVDGNTYYYLEHSYREGNSVKKKEVYIGTTLPLDIDYLKQNFLREIYKEKWYHLLDCIKKGYARQRKLMSVSSREKGVDAFMIRFTYDTQKIEGSKLTLRETANLLEHGITPQGKPIRDVKEAEAHKQVFYSMLASPKDLSLIQVLHWHKQLFSLTKPDIAGRIRAHGVAISGSRFVPPSPVEVNPLLEDFFKWYHHNRGKIHPVELAALVHLKYVTIHPFGDGNGRISRLMMNFVLHKSNYPLLNIPYENRTSYYNALERAQVKANDHIFVQWFIKKYIKENKRYGK